MRCEALIGCPSVLDALWIRRSSLQRKFSISCRLLAVVFGVQSLEAAKAVGAVMFTIFCAALVEGGMMAKYSAQ